MVGKLELKRYKYTDVVLPKSLVTVSGRVNVVEDNIYSTEGQIDCSWMVDEKTKKTFSFSLNQQSYGPGMNGEIPEKWDNPTVSTSNWPSGISVDETILEFKNFVLSDIA